MEVVRPSVEVLRGSVHVTSRQGAGRTLRPPVGGVGNEYLGGADSGEADELDVSLLTPVVTYDLTLLEKP